MSVVCVCGLRSSSKSTDHRLKTTDQSHFFIGTVLSKSRLSSNTLTVGSPRKPNCRPVSVCGHDSPQFLFSNAAFASDARHLKLSRGGRNVRIEAGARGCHQINRHWLARILSLQLLNIGFDAINQFLIGWSKIRA